MSIKQVDRKVTMVTLLRPGVGSQPVILPEGSTLADFLRGSGAGTSHSMVLVDGKRLEELVIPKAGTVITIVPAPENAASRESWHELMGDFHNDPVFEEMMQAVEEARDAEKESSRFENR